MSENGTAKTVLKNPTLPTPMMQQYLEIKSRHEDAILFYRLGDFYEMFFADAIEASKILDLTLTSRNKTSEDPVPMCGIPYHAAEAYIAKLIEAGKKVVICEQTEDPKQAKGIVRREVTKIITPGTVFEETCLEAKINNYILCAFPAEKFLFCALCDVSTGKLEYFSLDELKKIHDEIARFKIREFIYPEFFRDLPEFQDILKKQSSLYHCAVNNLFFDLHYSQDFLREYYHLQTVNALGLNEKATCVVSGLLNYLKDNHVLSGNLLDHPQKRELQDFLFLDETTIRNLELFETAHDRSRYGSLVWHLDQCETPMGSRLLASWLQSPLKKKEPLEERFNAVEEFLNEQTLFEKTKNHLAQIFDLERLANRFVTASAHPRDAKSLEQSFQKIESLKENFKNVKTPLLKTLCEHLCTFPKLKEKIEKEIQDDPPLTVKEGGIIKDGIHKELDELRTIEKSGKNYILSLEKKEKERTKISSLKIRYNNVFGYYIEITHTHKDKIPENYIRKQTLTNAERYITEELKNYEAKVLGANERIKVLEYDLFCALRNEIATHAVAIKKTAQAIAGIDVLLSFALVSRKFHYQKPVLTEDPLTELATARHPILERVNPTEKFIPNDVNLGGNCLQMIITGPNMAGKSTVMRMVALITVLAQIGCFVPCERAKIGICDRILTRIGAHDHLQKGLSTFMVEMVETAKILREATSKSLILLDEIGRGTSTFDGLSLAWAIAEDLHDRVRARTLFATHYHELCDLAEQKPAIKNFHMSVKEWNEEIIFLRKLKSGGTNRSYGVTVAGMAGLPSNIIRRAKEVLRLLEIKDLSFQNEVSSKKPTHQMPLFEES